MLAEFKLYQVITSTKKDKKKKKTTSTKTKKTYTNYTKISSQFFLTCCISSFVLQGKLSTDASNVV